MSTATTIRRLTPEEYFALERDAPERHEFLDGELVAMAGGSRTHKLVATPAARLLGNHLEGTPCRVYQSDMKVRIARAERFYYPDIMVCREPLAPDPNDYYETEPTLIVEVLSTGTAANDDGEKRINYQSLESLQEYPLLDPHVATARLYRRTGGFWTRFGLSADEVLELACIGFRMRLGALLGVGRH